MSTGKIKTLFSDKEKTEALFPRTKTSAVSNSEGKGLDAILENLPYFSDTDSSNVANAPLNADTLGGHPASDFALAHDVKNMTYEDVGAAPAGDYATESFVTNKIAEAQLSGGGSGEDIDLSGYATKDDLNKIDYPVDSVNGKAGVVQLTATDVGARPNNWLPTLDDIGAVAKSDYKKITINIPANSGVTIYPAGSSSPGHFCGLIFCSGWQSGLSAMYAYGGYHGPFNSIMPLRDCDKISIGTSTTENAFVLFNHSAGNGITVSVFEFVADATPTYKTGVGNVTSVVEWSNPPMLPSVEYRTTERLNGKPVYCKYVDGGYLPNAGSKIYTIAENARPFHVFGPSIMTVNFGGNIPLTLQDANVISCFVNGNTVQISCGGDRSSIPFYFVVKYTKTTD